MTIPDTAMLQLSECKFGESKWNPYWLGVLTSLSKSKHGKYAPNEHEDHDDQYDPYAISSEKMSC